MRYLVEIVSTLLLISTLTKSQRQGDLCVVAGSIRPGVCRHIFKCPIVLEAAIKRIPHQVCASPENRLIVCCPWVPGQETGLKTRNQENTNTPRKGDNCTMVDTGRAGLCSRFANCQTAIAAASKGVFPQMCASEGTVEIVCCPLVTLVEGDQCSVARTERAGKCLRISKCPVAVEAALEGITPQICALDGSVPIVCCEELVEDDNCTVGETGKAGVCRTFANCQTAKEAANKGISPQTCDVQGTVQFVCCPLVTVIEGSNCTLKETGIAGACRPFANCKTAKEAASRGILPQKCDLTDNESQLVCCTEPVCPPLPKGLVTQLRTGSKAADYCIELAEKIHPCQKTPSGWTRGDICPLITPNSNIKYQMTPMTTTAEAPYYGKIGTGSGVQIRWQRYTVSLVSDRWVVCAAHVITGMGSYNVHFIGLGGTFTLEYNPKYTPGETFGVTNKHFHPLYKKDDYSRAYSIALLRLDRRVTFTSRILPACLHTGQGRPLPDSGFMHIDLSQRMTTMQRVSEEECSRIFPAGSSQYPAGIKHDLEICSRPANTTRACMGGYDGAPLTLPNSPRVACTHLLVGLVSSWVYTPCTVINTRISPFIPWIEDIVWPESEIVD